MKPVSARFAKRNEGSRESYDNARHTPFERAQLGAQLGGGPLEILLTGAVRRRSGAGVLVPVRLQQ